MKWLFPITVLLYCVSGYFQSEFYITCVDNTCGEMRASIDFVRDYYNGVAALSLMNKMKN